MDSLMILGPAVAVLAFIVAAVAWGVDSREMMTDDRAR
jgi:hypothetical protein